MVVKAQISELLMISLILPVIFCEASDKPLAFQFANKTQQSQGQKII
jgi:hypothetical protein